MTDALEQTLLGDAGQQWMLATAIFVATTLLGGLAIKFALARVESLARRTSTDVDDVVAELLRRTKSFFILIVALWLAAESLSLSPRVDGGIERLVLVGLLVQAAIWGSGLVTYGMDRYRRRQLSVDPGAATAIGAMSFVGRALVWTVVVLVILDNLGVDVTALVTGLGIGGVAVALALQNVLSDLFGSLSIVLDEPFVVGDFVVVGDAMGTVEHVGLKTTRLRALSGEQLVLSNSDLLGSRIRNFKRMSERRAVFQVGVTYETSHEKLGSIPAIVRAVVEAQAGTRFDRSHFKSYGAFSLDFETVYYVLTPDYNTYMDVQQAINLELFERFQQEGIDFAYPTHTVRAHVYDGAPNFPQAFARGDA